MSGFRGGYRGRNPRGRGDFGGRSSYRGSSTYRGRGDGGRGTFTAHTGPPIGTGGDTFSLDVCRFHITQSCRHGDNCNHGHFVQLLADTSTSTQNLPAHAMLQFQGQSVLTASGDGQVKLWSSADGKSWAAQKTFAFHSRLAVSALAASDGVLFCGYEAPFALAPAPLATGGGVGGGDSAAGGGGGVAERPVTVGMIRVMRTADGSSSEAVIDATNSPYAHPNRVNCLALSGGAGTADGGAGGGGPLLLFSGGEEGIVRAWQEQGGEFRPAGALEGHVRGVTAMLTTPQGLLWTASADTTIRVWNMATAACVGVLSAVAGGNGHRGEITGMLFAPTTGEDGAAGGAAAGGHVVTSSLDHYVRVWNAANGEHVYGFDCSEAVTAIALIPSSPAGALILIGLQTGSIVVRDYPGFGLAFELMSSLYNVAHRRPIRSILRLVPPAPSDAVYFASTDDGGRMLMWELRLPPSD